MYEFICFMNSYMNSGVPRFQMPPAPLHRVHGAPCLTSQLYQSTGPISLTSLSDQSASQSTCHMLCLPAAPSQRLGQAASGLKRRSNSSWLPTLVRVATAAGAADAEAPSPGALARSVLRRAARDMRRSRAGGGRGRWCRGVGPSGGGREVGAAEDGSEAWAAMTLVADHVPPRSRWVVVMGGRNPRPRTRGRDRDGSRPADFCRSRSEALPATSNCYIGKIFFVDRL